MTPDVFTMMHVHKCYPWISSTTVYDRIISGQIPTSYKKGSGEDIKLEFDELIQIGVDDEMAVLGARQNLKQVADVVTYFAVPQARKQDYEVYKPKNLLPLREPFYYYKFFRYEVRVRIEVLHPVELTNKSRRHKRSQRIYHVIYQPDFRYYPEFNPAFSSSEAVGHTYYEDGSTAKPATCISSASINVEKIYDHCRSALGLNKREMEAVFRAMSEAANEGQDS